MSVTRRYFLQTCSAVALGFAGLHQLLDVPIDALAAVSPHSGGYGPLVADPKGVLDLPKSFTYRVVSRAGDTMTDGFIVPGAPDAMGAFPGPRGTTILVCNHELMAKGIGPFGAGNTLMRKAPASRVYDLGAGLTPSLGGTTTLVYDTKAQRLEKQYLSLVGTSRNCAGGVTPWGTWISCEEINAKKGYHKDWNLHCSADHGYNFEVPVGEATGLVDPVPLKAMGRFIHEAVAVDPRTGIVYQTEDRGDGLIYRFIPRVPGKLHEGGRLQAMCLVEKNGMDTRNWETSPDHIEKGRRMPVRWIDLDNVESPEDDLRIRGAALGACCFARGEGMWMGSGEVFFACTSGGLAQIGQLFRYIPSPHEGTPREADEPGTLDLFIEPNDSELIENADNLTVAPWGDLVVCEDRGGAPCRLVCVTRDGHCGTFGLNRLVGEFAGAVFSPDGSTLFVNLQDPGLTLAIVGPWRTS